VTGTVLRQQNPAGNKPLSGGVPRSVYDRAPDGYAEPAVGQIRIADAGLILAARRAGSQLAVSTADATAGNSRMEVRTRS
jgi:hypothetical protein